MSTSVPRSATVTAGSTLGALVLAQLLHDAAVLIPPETRAEESGTFPSVLGAVAVVVPAAVAVLIRRDRVTPRAAALVGAVVAVGFAAYHGMPVASSFTHPYWAVHHGANAAQWVTLFGIIAAGGRLRART